MKNFTSAYKVDSHEDIEDVPSDFDDKGHLVYLHIFSISGKFINEFFPPKFRDSMPKKEDTIVFMSGTEFLVCKTV